MTTKHHTQTSKPDDPNADISTEEWNEDHDVTNGEAIILAGQEYVDVPHGLTTTPNVNRIKLTPHDKLGGKDFWLPPDHVNETTFRIQISSMDLEENHAFGYIIV